MDDEIHTPAYWASAVDAAWSRLARARADADAMGSDTFGIAERRVLQTKIELITYQRNYWWAKCGAPVSGPGCTS